MMSSRNAAQPIEGSHRTGWGSRGGKRQAARKLPAPDPSSRTASARAESLSNEPDMEESGVLEENNNLLNPIEVGEVDEFQRLCVERSESEAVEDGLLDDARAEAEERLTAMFFAALGEDYKVAFEWREAPAEETQVVAEQ